MAPRVALCLITVKAKGGALPLMFSTRIPIKPIVIAIILLTCAATGRSQGGRPRTVNDTPKSRPTAATASAPEEKIPPLAVTADFKAAKGKPGDARPRNLPYKVEVGEGITQPGAELIIAIGRVTVIHCPEAPLQVLLGKPALFINNPNDPGLPESVEGNTHTDFYLRPIRVGRTNLIIEMKSATVDVSLRIVEVEGGARVGDYHGEAFVRLPKFREDSAATKQRLATVEGTLAECKASVLNLREEAERTKVLLPQQAEERAFIDGLAAFQAAAAGISKGYKSVSANSVNVRQVTKAVRTTSGSWWVVVEIENQQKGQTLFIQEISAERSRLYISGGSLRGIAPKEKLRVAVAIKPGGQSGVNSPPALNVTVQGAKITLPLQAAK